MIRFADRMDVKNAEILFATLNTLLKTHPDMIFVKDMNLTYVAATQSFATMMGKSSLSEIIGKKDHDLLHEELANRYVADDRKLLASKHDLIDYVEPLIDHNGEARYGHTSKYILNSSDGTPIGLLGISKDITREIRAYQQYQKEIEFLFTLPDNAYAAVFFDITNWRIIGERRQTIHGYTTPLFETIDAFLSLALPFSKSDAHDFHMQFTQEHLTQLYEQGQRDFSFEYERTLADGSIYWIREEFKFLMNPLNDHLNLMFIVRDIHQEKMNEQQLIQAATTDHMTGLLNRISTVQKVNDSLIETENRIHAAFMIDVDNFKSINDTYGHQGGDEALCVIADGIHLSGTPLAAVSLGVDYNVNGWFFSANLNYYDNVYVGFSQYRRLSNVIGNYVAGGIGPDGNLAFDVSKAELNEYGGVLFNPEGQVVGTYTAEQEKFDGGFMLDASIGKYIRLKKGRSLSINLSLNNITNNTNMRTGGYEQNRDDYYNTGVARSYRFSKNNRYYYAYAFNAFLNIGYRF